MSLRVEQALKIARIIVVAQMESIEECECHTDDRGKPRIDTMTPAAKCDYRRCERSVRLIDEALMELNGKCPHNRIEGRGKKRFCLDCETELRGEVVTR